MPSINIREDIPLVKLSTAAQYGTLIDDLEAGKSFEIPESDRTKILSYIKRKYGESRVYATLTHTDSKLYLQRLK